MAHTEVIDATNVKGLVGRIAWDGWWAIIDRSPVAQSDVIDDNGEIE